MQTIKTYMNPVDAGFDQSLLRAQGIAASLADEHSFTLGCQSATGGIRLMVPEHQTEAAFAILRREGFSSLPDDFEPPPSENVRRSGQTEPPLKLV